MSRILWEFGADKFFEYLVLQLYNFELLVGLKIIVKSWNHKSFDPSIDYLSFFEDQQ